MKTTITDISIHDHGDLIDVRVTDSDGVTERRYRGLAGGYLHVQAGHDYRQVMTRSARRTDADAEAVSVPRARGGQTQREVLLGVVASHLGATII